MRLFVGGDVVLLAVIGSYAPPELLFPLDAGPASYSESLNADNSFFTLCVLLDGSSYANDVSNLRL
jgi:hypothetical protein